MKVIVTGGSGNIGRFVVEELGRDHDVTVLDRKPPPDSGIDFREADIRDPAAVREAFQRMDAVVHLAAIPAYSPDIPPAEYMHVNVTGTFNVLEAAAANHVKTVVLASSDSTLGFVFATHLFPPDYFPLDEEHPLRPQDPYGLSKLLAEEIARWATRRYGLQTICLRFCWVWFPDTYARRKEIAKRNFPGNLKTHFGYVDVRDVAQACRLAVEAQGLGSDTFFITAADTYADEPTLELVRKHYPTVRQVGYLCLADPYASLFDIRKARKRLGYTPQHSWRDR